MTTDKYRIDRQTGNIYELNSDGSAYLYICAFFQIGATAKNRDSTIIKKIEAWKSSERG